jgi:hypothetical protein
MKHLSLKPSSKKSSDKRASRRAAVPDFTQLLRDYTAVVELREKVRRAEMKYGVKPRRAVNA